MRKRAIYVSSRASVPERSQMWRDLREAGWNITSTWIDQDITGQTLDFAKMWVVFQTEILNSDALVFYVEPEDFPVRGVYVEIGMALAYGIPVVIVAPNVKLEGPTMRPIGSWVKHPSVYFADSLEEAYNQIHLYF